MNHSKMKEHSVEFLKACLGKDEEEFKRIWELCNTQLADHGFVAVSITNTEDGIKLHIIEGTNEIRGLKADTIFIDDIGTIDMTTVHTVSDREVLFRNIDSTKILTEESLAKLSWFEEFKTRLIEPVDAMYADPSDSNEFAKKTQRTKKPLPYYHGNKRRF